MARYSPYPRRKYRSLFARWARRNVQAVAVLSAGMLGLIAFATFMLTVALPQTSFTWWLLGAVQVAVVGIYLHLLNASFLAHEGEAIWQLRGAWGEENTRDELRQAERKRMIWGRVDSIALRAGDLDHVVVTRSGGLVAIDSKWRSRPTDTDDMARDAHKVKLRAEAVMSTLLTGERGARHRSRANPLEVTSIVVLWGAAQHGVPEGARVDGIEFVAGRRLLAWLRNLDGQQVDEAVAEEVLQRLQTFRASASAPGAR